MRTQSLSFNLRHCIQANDLLDACAVRAQAYGRKQPHLRETFAQPDALDRQTGTQVMVCRDKISQHTVGTARLQLSEYGTLLIEQSAPLPSRYLGGGRAEITRLATLPDADPMVRLALMKACYQACLAQGTRHLVIGTRRPALIRIYLKMGFEDVFGPDEWVPLAHAGMLPHRILAFDVTQALTHWRSNAHPLLGFMVDTVHPDIEAPRLLQAERQAA